MSTDTFAEALPHGEISEVFDDVFFVTGTVQLSMGGPTPMSVSRNMTVVRQGDELTLFNTVRLNDDGLEQLDKLGKVRHVVRLAGYHGMDDPFYGDRYDAPVHAVKGQTYFKGVDASGPPYFTADVELTAQSALPVDGMLYTIDSKPSEGLFVLDRHGGVAIAGDALQNWEADEFFDEQSAAMMKNLGFLQPHNIGPGWLRGAEPPISQLKGILDLKFEHVLPAHGKPVVDNAREKYSAVIESL